MVSDVKATLVVSLQNAFWVLFVVVDVVLTVPAFFRRLLLNGSSLQPGSGRKKTIVIVGGNFAGLSALRALQEYRRNFRIVLVEQNSYFEYTPGILRLFCDPSLISELVRPLPNGMADEVIQGKVFRTDKQSIQYVDSVTKSSKKLDFDYLVVATGSTFNHPISASVEESTVETRTIGWRKASQQIHSASSILILGGGAVGTELAAELVDFYPGKKIALVDASPRLVPIFPKSVSAYAEKWLRSKGVRLILGHLLESWDTKGCTFKNGTKSNADLVFVCFGDKPNSAALIDSIDPLPQITLDRRKCVKVEETLLVKGRQNIFCCGDVAAPPAEGMKQAFHAEVQGHLAAENVIHLASKKPLLRYPQDAAMDSPYMPLVYVLSLGRYDGVIGFNNLTIPGPLAAVLKWIIEWTKVRQMLARPVGILVWKIGDTIAFFLSKHLVPPAVKKQS